MEFEGSTNLLDADAIAKRISPFDPRQGAMSAGREVIKRTREYIQRRTSFALETTLSGNWTFPAIQAALENGFIVRMIFVCLDRPELSIQCISERVSRGGHHVPPEDVRRRYFRSIENARELIKIVTEASVYDNSKSRARKILEFRGGNIVFENLNDAPWAEALLHRKP